MKLGWWGQPSSYSLHLADRLITAGLVETLAWKSSRPTTSSPLSHSPCCLSNTDATVHSNHWFLRVQHPLTHFWVADRHLGTWQRAYFLSNNNVPSGQISLLLEMLRHLRWSLIGNNQLVKPFWDSCCVDSAPCCLLLGRGNIPFIHHSTLKERSWILNATCGISSESASCVVTSLEA